MHLIARGVEIVLALGERLLRLTNGRVFATALIDRNRELTRDRAGQDL